MRNPFRFISPAALACACLAGFAAQADNVIDKDDRVDAPIDAYPYRAIGKLHLPSGVDCTGFLVGPDLIASAAHCISKTVEESGVKKAAFMTGIYAFLPAFGGTPPARSAEVEYIWYGTLDRTANPDDDWAFLSLKEPLGLEFGWLSFAEMPREQAVGNLELVGYSADWKQGNVASMHRGCSARGLYGALWRTDCDSTRGISGAPLLHQDPATKAYSVVGIQSAEFRGGSEESLIGVAYSDTTSNLVVPAARAIPKLREIQREAQRGSIGRQR